MVRPYININSFLSQVLLPCISLCSTFCMYSNLPWISSPKKSAICFSNILEGKERWWWWLLFIMSLQNPTPPVGFSSPRACKYEVERQRAKERAGSWQPSQSRATQAGNKSSVFLHFHRCFAVWLTNCLLLSAWSSSSRPSTWWKSCISHPSEHGFSVLPSWVLVREVLPLLVAAMDAELWLRARIREAVKLQSCNKFRESPT